MPIMVYTKGKYTGLTGKALNVLCNLDMNGCRLLNFTTSKGHSGWSGTIPIVKEISGGYATEGTIDVENGIITAVSKSK